MLMEGALDKVATAKGCIERGDLEGKSKQLTWAMSIVNGLRTSLDLETGGAIAANLNDLYDYMNRRLLYANMHNSVEALDEVFSLLSELREAWSAIADVDQPSAAENGEILQEMSS